MMILAATSSLLILMVTAGSKQVSTIQTEGHAPAHCDGSLSDFTKDRASAAERVRAGDFSGGRDLMERAYRICQDHTVGVELAELEISAGDSDAAERLIDDLLQQKDTAELHEMLGGIEASRRHVKEAAEQYQVAAQLQPSEDYIFAFGTSLMKLDFAAAMKVLAYGLQVYPSSVKMHVGLALALYAQDRTDEGAKLLCDAASLDPLDVHPMEVLADTGVVPPSLQLEVQRHLANLHERYPADGTILFDYAMVKAGRWSGDGTGATPELVSQLKAALALDPRLAKAFFELSVIDDQKKNLEAEISDLKSAIAIDPDVPQYHFRLAFAYRQAGDPDAFRNELKRYQELHGRAPGGN